MEFALDLGAKIDVATSGELTAGLDGLRNDIFSQRKPKPLYSHAVGASAIAADGTASIDLGSPATGRIWNVTGYVLFGNDDNALVANALAAIYFGDPDRVGIMGLVIPRLTIPSGASLSDEVYWCHPNENVVVTVSGTGLAGTQVGAKVFYTDWPEAAVAGHSGK
jgi:hypothetical protein